jgi:hypothetical protein
MPAPSLLNARRFAPAVRLRLEILFAKAFESLAETYRVQATEFVRRLRGRLTIEDAMDRYFREVGVPYAMEETVRARALITLAPFAHEHGLSESRGAVAGWAHLRPEQLVESLRRRAHSAEETSLDCRMAASISDEAVAATHVAMALETAELLAGDAPLDEAIMHYVRHFNLPSVEAQIIFRRALAAWAERHPTHDLIADELAVCATPVIPFGVRTPLTLHVIG